MYIYAYKIFFLKWLPEHDVKAFYNYYKSPCIYRFAVNWTFDNSNLSLGNFRCLSFFKVLIIKVFRDSTGSL
jgi:hypothetical protein